jgi:hypothetical protein
MTDKCELQEEHVGICKGSTKRWLGIVLRSFVFVHSFFSALYVGRWRAGSFVRSGLADDVRKQYGERGDGVGQTNERRACSKSPSWRRPSLSPLERGGGVRIRAAPSSDALNTTIPITTLGFAPTPPSPTRPHERPDARPTAPNPSGKKHPFVSAFVEKTLTQDLVRHRWSIPLPYSCSDLCSPIDGK